MSFTIDLEGRRALVTGSGQGVGRSIALFLAEAGAVVAVNDIDRSRAESVVDEIATAGGKAVALPFDVTDWASVNNAGNAGAEGFSAMVPFAETDPADWPRYFNVNLFGTMHATRASLPAMIEGNWGRVINIVSDAGRIGDARLAPYAAAKAGAAGFARSVAREVGRHNITVNNIALGTMDTPATANAARDTPEAQARLKEMLKSYVIRRRGQPEDVAGLVTYLSGPLADWITGQTYLVNGGYSFSL
jgi:NAD(P)-dependent dehydrogenase (short-subunit alcohol dehydrogenase family)